MRTGQLPEKPWKADASIRLAASIFICGVMIGGVVLIMFRFFGQPHRTATAPFLVFSIGTIACFLGAVFVLVLPWSFETLLRKLLIFLFCIYGGFFLLWLAQRGVPDTGELESTTANLIIGILSLQGAALVLVHFFLREHHTGWIEGFGFGKNNRKAVLLGTGATLLVVPTTWILQILSSWVLEWLRLHPKAQETVQILQGTEGLLNHIATGIATIIIAPVAEEILFRGIMYPAIKRMGYPRIAFWATALVFATIHHNLQTFVPLVFLAVVLICLYEYTGNLLACIVTHSLFNAVNFIFLYLFPN